MAAPFRPCSHLGGNLRARLLPALTKSYSNREQTVWSNERSKKKSSDKLFQPPVISTFLFHGLTTFTLSPNGLQKTNFSTKANRTCWKCGNNVDTKDELFFCKCGVVQDVKGLDFFELMGFPESFDIDTKALAQRYRELQIQLHPDKHSLKSEREKQIAEEQSSFVNKAYFTLLKPLPRAQYLLEQRGDPIEEENTGVDQQFLMQVMEINEEIMDADTPDSLQPIQMSNDVNIKHCVSEISKAFSSDNIEKAKEWTIKLKYFSNINDKIINIHQRHFGAH